MSVLQDIIVRRVNPDAVLPRAQARTIRLNGAPLDYLRRGKQITDAQYAAGRAYEYLLETAGVDTLNGGFLPAANRPATVFGERVEAENCRVPTYEGRRDPTRAEGKRDEGMSVRRQLGEVERRLSAMSLAVLRDLIGKNLTVGDIATRFFVGTKEMNFVVKIALWELVAIIEEIRTNVVLARVG